MIRWLSKKLVNPLGNDGSPTMLLVVAAFVAFAIAGFAVLNPFVLFGRSVGDLEALRPVPIYLVLSALLLALQVTISLGRPRGHIIYLLVTSGLALAVAGIVTYSTDQRHLLTRLLTDSTTYLVINFALLAVFVVDAVLRHLPGTLATGRAGTGGASGSPGGASRLVVWFGDFAGLALLSLFMWKSLDLLENLGRSTDSPLISLVQRVSGIHLTQADLTRFEIAPVLFPGTSLRMADLDLKLALVATIAALLFAVAAGLHVDTTDFRRQLLGGARSVLLQVLISLRFVLSPLIWLIPAFLIALFSAEVSSYYGMDRRFTGYLQLFLPFPTDLSDPTSRFDYSLVLNGVVLGAIAVACVMVAVVIVESDTVIITKTIGIFVDIGLRFAVTYIIFLYSLAVFNALLILSNPSISAPFGVGAAGSFAFLAAILAFALSSFLRRRGFPPTPVTPSADEGNKVPVGAGAQAEVRQPLR